jgi:DNA-binding XRE family transcriptional regulator
MGIDRYVIYDIELGMKALEKGWAEGSAGELLGLSRADMAMVEAKVALTKALRDRRISLGMTQATLARATGTSQSRVARIEACDPSVSIDLILRALFASGLDKLGISAVLAQSPAAKPRVARRRAKMEVPGRSAPPLA